MTILELDVYISIDRGPYFQLLQIWQCGKNVAQKPKEFFFRKEKQSERRKKIMRNLHYLPKLTLIFSRPLY